MATVLEPWLIPSEQREVCEFLLQADLLKYSNKRNLPLRMGGTTDIYITLRDARNDPQALDELAHLYANPLGRLRVDRFAEVPDSVSCLAGPLAIMSGKPYITIRERPKEGRVTKASMIGSGRRGERILMIDDVVTNGESKIAPYHECIKAGLRPDVLAVLVDRQQGWQKVFDNEGINMSVWPGMTLHDVRRYLIEENVMERCSPAIEKKNPIIVALDGKSWEEILPIVDKLRTTGCILKVNDLMFNKGIEWILANLQIYGRLMADLKGHDIPNTIANIMKHFGKNPPWAVTVHASGGKEMIRTAVDAFRGTDTKVLAVTVLTSFDRDTCEEVYHRLPLEQVSGFAIMARDAGAHGLVCSPEEIALLKPLVPEMELVTPSVRSLGADPGDQKRVTTPKVAIDRGASNIVMGRQFLGADDPVAEVHRVLKEELGISL